MVKHNQDLKILLDINSMLSLCCMSPTSVKYKLTRLEKCIEKKSCHLSEGQRGSVNQK